MGLEMLYDARDLRAQVFIGDIPINPQDAGDKDALWLCATSALRNSVVAIKLTNIIPSSDVFFSIFVDSTEVHLDSLDAPIGAYTVSFSLRRGFKYPHNVFSFVRFNRHGELLATEIGLAAANNGIYIVGREIFCGQVLYAPHPMNGRQMPYAVGEALKELWKPVFRRMRACAKPEDLPPYQEMRMPPPLPLNGLQPQCGLVREWNPARLYGRVETREWGMMHAHAMDLEGVKGFPCLREGEIVSIARADVANKPGQYLHFRARGIRVIER